ncbi:MAG: polyprenyl synthetase family protein [Alphaproteobacteria bacterium]|nr:MAG: polyprenyl synthetase family protein [Alphaproteobacteria bacterium]TAE84216.1 MAG: polyprenyl synthetase family protein [Alphaproteobacteria bacterium]TAF14092.1 MAG: polyprenyl synthetase family protein [Alphaproteobacteria bacterium]TAF39794.1 MAG: polyprenyl synthetase family protein [Alphaproteobacteria bacterium]
MQTQSSSVGDEGIVMEAMRYASLSGGKRLRPFLTVTCANIFGVSQHAALLAASAIEFIHTYSLVHDDLPAMDDDDLRRGKPSCHVKFGEAVAILAGDALQAFAFQILSSQEVHSDPYVRCELVRTVAKAAGANGLVGGQMLDLAAEKKHLSVDEIIRLQRLKTGEIFAVSCEVGAMLGKAAPNLRNALRRYAHDLGLAFQITDDLLDAEGTREETGKHVRKDEQRGKATLVKEMGIDRARAQAQTLAQQAIAHLEVFDTKHVRHLQALAEYVVTRKQ